MVDERLLKEALDLALASGGDFADIFVEHRRATGIGLEGGKIERVHSGIDMGAGIRVINGDSTAYAYTNDLSREGLLEAARMVSHAARGEKKEYHLDLRRVQPVVEFSIKEPPDTIKPERKVEAVQSADRAARAVDGDRIKQVMVGYGDVVQKVVIANSDGEYVEDERIRTRLMVQVVAASGRYCSSSSKPVSPPTAS